MGWTFVHKERGTSIKSFFESEFNFQGESVSDTVLDCAKVGSVYYLAVERQHKDGKRFVYGLVCLTAYRDRMFGYKKIDETMGPVEARCPVRILNRLSPVEDFPTPQAGEWAKKWRESCRAYAISNKGVNHASFM